MRIGIATVHTPGIFGGAEFLVNGLVDAVREGGHQVHKISVPFSFDAKSAARTMDLCAALDWKPYGGGQLDKLICLKFPSYSIEHPDKRVWLLHQHRAAYELYGTPYGWPANDPAIDELRQRIHATDREQLSKAQAVFTIAKRVSERLSLYSGVESKPIYHPPADAGTFVSAPALPYLFVPSRLEVLKRQDLVLKALALTKSPVQAIFAGGGGQRIQLEELAASLNLEDRIRFVGEVDRAEMIALYMNAQAVFFGPLDEDYGYVTLEAMLAAKPVVTCSDSGGPLEFVVDGQTGFVVSPEPQAIADALEKLMTAPNRAQDMGQAGLERYRSMDISWHRVVEHLLADLNATRP
jgi:glycosyltransferase involved in cell wall biosynthesis